MRLDVTTSALVLVDYQHRLMPAIDEGETAIENGLFLASIAHALDVPVLGTEQNPQGLGPNDARIRAVCAQTIAKRHFDATADGLVDALRAACPDVHHVVVAGCEAHVCLLQTALGLIGSGLHVVVDPTACGSRSAAEKALALQRIGRSGAVLASGESIAFEWLRSCDHPRFRTVLELIKARDRSPNVR